MRVLFVLLLLALDGCRPSQPPAPSMELAATGSDAILSAGFVISHHVFNSELMAPYDILHHTIFRNAERYVEPFIVSADGQPVETFEGITVQPHFSFATAPFPDILVIPSTEGSMDRDLADPVYMDWLREAISRATWVITLCDGAFPLAATGVLDGRVATTFPADRDALQAAFPAVDVRHDARFVVDGKYITSVGGGMSYEPALHLVEALYGKESAALTAEGLVWTWDPATVPHVIAGTP